jgi:hypothetical protein
MASNSNCVFFHFISPEGQSIINKAGLRDALTNLAFLLGRPRPKSQSPSQLLVIGGTLPQTLPLPTRNRLDNKNPMPQTIASFSVSRRSPRKKEEWGNLSDRNQTSGDL